MKASEDLKRYTLKGIPAVAAAVILLGLGSDGTRPGSFGQKVPFTAEFVTTSTNCDRGTAITLDQFYAVRSDGATSLGLSGAFPRRRKVTDYAAKLEVTLSDAYRIKVTYDYGAFPLRARRVGLGPRCSPPDNRYTYVGEDSILGYRAYHYLAPPIVEDHGSEETHYWYAADLNCFIIKTLSYRRDRFGKTTSIFEKTTATIKPGEPDPRLFAVPDDYREVKPSEFERTLLLGMVQERQGTEAVRSYPIDGRLQEYFSSLDKKYETARKRPQ